MTAGSARMAGLGAGLSGAFALGLLGLCVAAAASLAGGRFGYPLDDVLIHLSIADRIAAGGYGVQAGAPAAAASSLLWPGLLALFVPFGALFPAPLILNALALAAWCALWMRLVARAGWGRGATLALALAGPLVLHALGLALLGMEHLAHAAATLAILLGVIELAERRRVGWMLALGVLLAPMLRYEGLGAALLACLAALALAGPRPALALAAAALVPLALFSGFLVSLGLDPAPSSVLAKSGGAGAGTRLAVMLGQAIELAARGEAPTPGHAAALLGEAAAPVLAALALLCLPPLRGARPAALWAAGLAAAAVAGHMILGGGTPHSLRYEGYAISLAGAALVFAAGPAARRAPREAQGNAGARPAGRGWRGAALSLGLLAAALATVPSVLRIGVGGVTAIDAQQRQMARLAHEVARGPVAVNDLGWVAWRNPHPVLDLWGLASPEARRLRRGGAAPGWPERLAAERGVKLIMVYDRWLDPYRAEDSRWVEVGRLRTLVPRGALGGVEVTLYAPDREAAPALREALAAFAPTLPESAELTVTHAWEART